jgi:hypothetical protein
MEQMEWKKQEDFEKNEKNEGSQQYRTAVWLQPSRSAVWSRRQPVYKASCQQNEKSSHNGGM